MHVYKCMELLGYVCENVLFHFSAIGELHGEIPDLRKKIHSAEKDLVQITQEKDKVSVRVRGLSFWPYELNYVCIDEIGIGLELTKCGLNNV